MSFCHIGCYVPFSSLVTSAHKVKHGPEFAVPGTHLPNGSGSCKKSVSDQICTDTLLIISKLSTGIQKV
jgi:hypothetical protein